MDGLSRLMRHDRWNEETLVHAGLAAELAVRLGLHPTGSSILGVPVAVGLERLQRALAEADVAAAVRAGEARISFHVYNTPADVDYVAGVLAPLM